MKIIFRKGLGKVGFDFLRLVGIDLPKKTIALYGCLHQKHADYPKY